MIAYGWVVVWVFGVWMVELVGVGGWGWEVRFGWERVVVVVGFGWRG